jgi:signal transduction histidine kinase
LPFSHSIIVEKHQGMLYFESEIGKGTTFIIKLPLEEVCNGASILFVDDDKSP